MDRQAQTQDQAAEAQAQERPSALRIAAAILICGGICVALGLALQHLLG